MTWALLGDLVLALAGRGVLLALAQVRPPSRSAGPALPVRGFASLAFGLLVGAVVLGFLVTTLGVLGLPVRPWPFVGPVIGGLALVGGLAGRTRRHRPGAGWPVGAAGLVAGLVGCRALLSAGRALIHSNDEYAIWALHGRVLFRTGHLDPAVFTHPEVGYPHLDYPLLLPSVLSWTASWAGGANDGAAHLQVALLGVALLVVVAASVRRLAGAWAAVAAVLVVAMTAGLLTFYGQLVMADVPAAGYAVAAALLVMLWAREASEHRDHRLLSAIAALLLGALLTKNEGALWVVAVVCGGLVATRGGWPARSRLLVAAAAAVTAYLPWVVFVHAHGLSNEVVNGTQLAPRHLRSQFGHLAGLQQEMARHWPGLHGLGLLALLLAAWLGIRSGHARLVGQAAVTVAVSWLGMTVVYLGTPADLDPSASRTLIFPALISGLALPVLAGLALRSPSAALPTHPHLWRSHRPGARIRTEGPS